MKHGRPHENDSQIGRSLNLEQRMHEWQHVAWTNHDGWRREHVCRVWQAIGGILQGIACLHIGTYAVTGDDTKIRDMALACGWREP